MNNIHLAWRLREPVGFKTLKSFSDRFAVQFTIRETKIDWFVFTSRKKNSQTQYSFCHFLPV